MYKAEIIVSHHKYNGNSINKIKANIEVCPHCIPQLFLIERLKVENSVASDSYGGQWWPYLFEVVRLSMRPQWGLVVLGYRTLLTFFQGNSSRACSIVCWAMGKSMREKLATKKLIIVLFLGGLAGLMSPERCLWLTPQEFLLVP